MTKRETYEKKTEDYLLPLMEEYHFELVDVEYVKEAGNWYLRAYIDKEGGITVDDCEVVSRRLGDWLDEKDFIEDSYILEVSSPGLDRPLKKDKDFARSIDKLVEVKLFTPRKEGIFAGEKEFIAKLVAYDPEKQDVTLADEDGSTGVWNRKELAGIRLAVIF